MIDPSKRDWGGQIVVGRLTFTYKQIIGFAGIVFWLLVMLMRTGSAGISSLVGTLQFLATILAITCATRTVRMRTLFSLLLAGGFAMGLVAIVGRILGLTAGTMNAIAGTAILEEMAILAPPIYLLWRWRAGRLWSLGMTDIFLMFAFCSAGFGMVETAYIQTTHSLDQFSWLPVVAWDGDRIRGYHLFNGHEIWGAVAGLAIGCSWLLRSKSPLIWVIALAGIAYGTIDHFVLDAHSSDLSVKVLGLLTGNGIFVLAAAIIGLLAAVFFDATIIYKLMPPAVQELPRRSLASRKGFGRELHLRALAFCNYQFERANEACRRTVATACLRITDRILIEEEMVSQLHSPSQG